MQDAHSGDKPATVSFSYALRPSIARFIAPGAIGPTLREIPFVSGRERLDGLQQRNFALNEAGIEHGA
jgi:hypothetical protein